MPLGCKEELIKSQEQNEHLTALVGKVTVEKEWLAKKLVSLGSSKLKQLVDLKPSSLQASSTPSLSVNHQCKLLSINRSSLYYSVQYPLEGCKPRANNTKQVIKNHITKVFEQIPIYGLFHGVMPHFLNSPHHSERYFYKTYRRYQQ